MDHSKIGKLIYTLRKEQGMTQRQLADLMNISDKTISKWERGLGCPDIELLSDLANIFHVDLSQLLHGQLTNNNTFGGNMKRIKFYVCPHCGNLLTALADTSITCCGKKLLPLQPKKAEGADKLTVEQMEQDYFISSDHDMSREHYISFVALLSADGLMLRKQYPEWNLQTRIPTFARGRLLWYCTQHGLFYQDL